MTDLEQLAARVAQVFKQIEHERMAGVPLLNPALQVQTLGFQTYEGHSIGIVITPWMMSLLLFPNHQDDWSDLELGAKVPHKFPSNTYPFVVNDIEGIGIYQAHSLVSPMREFHTQDQAVATADSFLKTLMEPLEQPDLDPDDEELLERLLRGEEPLTADLDKFAVAAPHPVVAEGSVQAAAPEERTAKPISRRDLLRGKLRRKD